MIFLLTSKLVILQIRPVLPKFRGQWANFWCHLHFFECWYHWNQVRYPENSQGHFFSIFLTFQMKKYKFSFHFHFNVFVPTKYSSRFLPSRYLYHLAEIHQKLLFLVLCYQTGIVGFGFRHIWGQRDDCCILWIIWSIYLYARNTYM